VLGLINRQDRYLARRTCHARRRELGARTTTLVLPEDKAGEAVLASVDLASSFPSVRTLVLRCSKDVFTEDCLDRWTERWTERFAAFISRNAAALQQLRHLDLGYDMLDAGVPTSITSTALATLAQLPGLQSLHAWVAKELSPPCWAALGSLRQLTSLRLNLCAVIDQAHLQHIVDAAPQLRELWLAWAGVTSPGQLAYLTRLRSLCSLELCVEAEAAPAVRSLTALQGLTHLALTSDKELGGLLGAVGQLTGLVSLRMWWIGGGPLQPLAALQRLTSLLLPWCSGEQEAQVLAGLGQLRRLEADFDSRAVAAASGLARLEECKVMLSEFCTEEEPQGGVPVKAPGHLCTNCACLAGFDLSSVHTLQLTYDNTWGSQEAGAHGQQLSRCPQLRALRLECVPVLPETLQAIAALPQLQHLCLHAWPEKDQQLDCSCLEVLAGCSRQLRQLTLGGRGMADLAESTLVALMVGLPQLRLLRLLGCSAALSQERCQALVGRLQLYVLQVDVVVDDGSSTADMIMARLEERWREA
jgi:hypothetical protein